jgi:hypothetical protein
MATQTGLVADQRHATQRRNSRRAAGGRAAALLLAGASGGLVLPAERAGAASLRLTGAAPPASRDGTEGALLRLPPAGGGDGGAPADGVGGEPIGPEWEATGVRGAVSRVRLSGGAVYALAAEGGAAQAALWRGERGADAWRALSPPAARIIDLAAGPLDERVVYLAGEGGIYRSSDAGQTWSTSLAAPASHQGLRVAVSPADGALVYAATGLFSGAAVWRSTDGGASWTRLRDLPGTLCTWSFPVVAPDPAVRQRVFLSYACLAGRNTSARLTVSEDLWATDGEALLTPSARNDDPLGFLYPQAVAFTPDRRHGVVAALRDQRLGGSALLRTDDGGRVWRALLNYGPSMAGGRQVGPNVTLVAFAAAPPAAPSGPGLERLFAGLARDGQGVVGSADGGTTWRRVGQGTIGQVHALALDDAAGILYAGTDRGLWRLPVE